MAFLRSQLEELGLEVESLATEEFPVEYRPRASRFRLFRVKLLQSGMVAGAAAATSTSAEEAVAAAQTTPVKVAGARADVLPDTGTQLLTSTARVLETESVHVLSLGVSCFPAAYLRDRDLRRYAGPFDWLFSSPGVVCSCLQDDFESFLDKSEYHDCGQAGKSGHKLYGKMLERSTVFNHHDPRLADHYDYFCRAVARLRLVLAMPSVARKLFLMCSLGAGFYLADLELQELFGQLCVKTCGFDLIVVRLIRGGKDDEPLPRVSLVMNKEADSGSMHVFDLFLAGGHAELCLEDSRDQEALERLLQPWLDGHVLGLDPLGISSFDPYLGFLECSGAFAPLEVLYPAADLLSPRLQPLSLECKVVLKEGVGRRVLKALRRSNGREVVGCRRLSFTSSTLHTRVSLDGHSLEDGLGLEPALLVVPQCSPTDEEGCQRVMLFMQGGPGVRAALVPEMAVGALCAIGTADSMPKLRFPKGYDLFRFADPDNSVSGGMCVHKASRTSESFVVVVSRT